MGSGKDYRPSATARTAGMMVQSDEERVEDRGITLKMPRPSVRWSAITGSGIAAAIATGHVQDPTAIWALVVLGGVGQLCDVIAALAAKKAR